MDNAKPLIVGEMNPYGADPYYALYPSPDGCTGERLCRLILRLKPDDYLAWFDRVNLCEGKWSMPAARARAGELLQESGGRPAIILLGRKVASAFAPDIEPLAPFMVAEDCTPVVVFLPHPSGLCRAWSEPGAFDRAHDLLERLGVLEPPPEPQGVFANCNVCGRPLHGVDEDSLGMCNGCAWE